MSEELFAAIAAGDTQGVRRLVEADPALASARDTQGVSALLSARYRSQLDIVDVLLAADPSLDVHDAAGLGVVDRVRQLLDERPDLLDAFAADGFTPLQLAAFFGHPGAVRLLLHRGASVDAVSRNPMRIQALHAAAASGNHEAVLLLLAAGADPSARQQGGYTPLMAVAARGDDATVDVLLERGADPTSTNDEGNDAAGLAAERGHATLADRLRRAAAPD